MKLYQEELMDHYRYPRHRGTLEHPDFVSGEHNPSCGDSISIQGKIEAGRVSALVFEGKGCVISQATASMLCIAMQNQTVESIMILQPEYICTLIGIELGPMRIKCALLSLDALQNGIKEYQKKRGIDNA
jgi:nitrogen fixation NifU-like protein